MKKIEDLINCLATVLVSYHEYRAKKVTDGTPQGARAHAVVLLAKPNYQESFKTLNTAATEKEKRCEPLLQYILDHIVYLKHINNQKKVFSAEEFTFHKKQITDLLTITSNLLGAEQKTTFSATTPNEKADGTFHIKPITLSGSLITGFTGWYLCKSGEFINDELFKSLFYKDQVNMKEFVEFTETILTRQQYPIMAAQATELTQVKKASDGQTDEIAALKAELEKAKKSEETLKAKLDAVTAKAAKTEAELSEQLKKASESTVSAAIPYSSPPVAGNPQVFFGKAYAEHMNKRNNDNSVSIPHTRS